MNPGRKDTPEDPLIDALLDETLGGVAPPDLSARILRSLCLRDQSTTDGYKLPLSVLASLAEPEAPPVSQFAPQPVLVRRPAKHRKSSSAWLQFTSTLAVSAAVLFVCYLGLQWNASHQKTIAKPVEPAHEPKVVIEKATPKKNVLSRPDNSIAKQGSGSSDIVVAPENKIDSSPDASNHVAESSSELKPSSDEAIVSFINEKLRDAWRASGVSPAASATDAEFCRRTYLRIVGRIPTVDEIAAYTLEKDSSKSEQLVDRLLDDPQFADERAQHWASVLANALIGRAVGTDKGEVASREGLEQYLKESLLAGKPFSQITKELVTASGAGQPGADNYSGAANFLLANADEKGIAAAARTCRVFLGVQLQCAQCHDHPTEPLTQKQFWAMTAFFRQMRVVNDRNNPAELVDQDYLGFDGRDEDGLVFYELPSGVMKAAAPEFLNGKTPEKISGRVAEVRRREELAKMIVASPNFTKAAVNRVWAHFLGYGFNRPSESVGFSTNTALPEVLDRLATEFAAHNYDLKSAMRWVALSDAFNRSSRSTTSQLADNPDEGTLPLFSRYYTRPLQAEEVFRSLQIAAKLRTETGENGDIEKARITWLGQLAKKSGDDESLSAPSVIQLNTSLARRAATPSLESLLGNVTSANMEFGEKVEHLFLAALSRKPTKKELDLARSLVGMNKRNEAAALEDIWWALLNSNEFVLDH